MRIGVGVGVRVRLEVGPTPARVERIDAITHHHRLEEDEQLPHAVAPVKGQLEHRLADGAHLGGVITR